MMPTLAARALEFFRPPELPGEARRTFRFHMAYALLDAAAGGILLNAPFIAIRAIQGQQNWQLPLRELLSGVGMLATLYLGSWMAQRRKMPFVFVPGMFCGLCSMAMALAIGNAFWFLMLFGISAMFEITTRPAVTTILRLNYPVEHRGHATGEVRKWSSLSFLVVNLLSAAILHWSGSQALRVAQIQIVCASLLSLSSFLCFRWIRVQDDPARLRHDLRPEVLQNLRDALAVVVRDRRYRRYLLGCFADGFCGMLYFPLISVFLSSTLGYGYLGCAALMHAVPALTAFALTGVLGQWFDRSNPWISWAWIRFAWGVDALLLAATPFYAALMPAMIVVLPVMGRTLRGSVQGGQWVLWWQIGVTHFAPPGEDTSRYVGVMVFLSGAIRLLASATGMLLAALAFQPGMLLVIGGLGVILSGVYSLWQAGRERKEHRPQTITEFEAQFTAASGH